MGITSPRRKTLRRRRRRLRPNLRRKKERLHLTPQRSTSTPMGEAELTPRSCLRTSKVRVEWYIAVRPTQRHVTGPLANVSSSRASDHSVPIDADMFSSDPLQVEDLNAEAPSGALSLGDEDGIATEAPPEQAQSANTSRTGSPEVEVVCLPSILLHSAWSKHHFL